MADLFRLSATEAAARIRDRNLTSEALVTSCLERIDSRESQVKAWVHLDRDFALAQAREFDRSASRGPLHGVPFAAKDIMRFPFPLLWLRLKPRAAAAADCAGT